MPVLRWKLTEAELYTMLPCFMCCSHGYRSFKIEIRSAPLSVLLSIHLFISSFSPFGLWLLGADSVVFLGLTTSPFYKEIAQYCHNGDPSLRRLSFLH